MLLYEDKVNRVAQAVVDASSMTPNSRLDAYAKAIRNERNEHARHILEQYVENAEVASQRTCALCDDTGIPHLILDVGSGCSLEAGTLDAIYEGVALGLKKLPARPMAVLGDEMSRIDQSCGLDSDPGAVLAAPMMIRRIDQKVVKLHVLMLGGGPEIRGMTKHIYHKHDWKAVEDEIVKRAIDGVRKLGCTPCTLAVGIGRSIFEASSLMLEAQIEGRYDVQSAAEQALTERVNAASIGPLGLGGDTSVLATFLKIGPQRASGVRIVSIRPCCCVEPRHAQVILQGENHG